MAVGDHLPVLIPPPSSSPITERRYLVQVATNNSSAFIQFPNNSRHLLLCIPTSRSRINSSKTRPIPCRKDIQSVSNNSKLSDTPSSNIISTNRKVNQSQPKSNPILNNSLLNYRKEQLKSPSIQNSVDFSQTTRICLSSQPLKTTSNDHQIPTIRAHTAPFSPRPTENSISDQQIIIPNEDENNDQQEIPRLDKTKYDYITRWLYEVEQATYSKKISSRTKRVKATLIQT